MVKLFARIRTIFAIGGGEEEGFHELTSKGWFIILRDNNDLSRWLASSTPERRIELTQSLSTDTRFITEQSFSTHASTPRRTRSPDLEAYVSGHPVARNQKATQDAATTSRCKTTERIRQLLADNVLLADRMTYQLRVSRLEDGCLYRYSDRQLGRRRPQKRHEPEHTPTWAIRSWGRWKQGTRQHQTRRHGNSMLTGNGIRRVALL